MNADENLSYANKEFAGQGNDHGSFDRISMCYSKNRLKYGARRESDYDDKPVGAPRALTPTYTEEMKKIKLKH